jgi:hypothetical protein
MLYTNVQFISLHTLLDLMSKHRRNTGITFLTIINLPCISLNIKQIENISHRYPKDHKGFQTSLCRLSICCIRSAAVACSWKQLQIEVQAGD